MFLKTADRFRETTGMIIFLGDDFEFEVCSFEACQQRLGPLASAKHLQG